MSEATDQKPQDTPETTHQPARKPLARLGSLWQCAKSAFTQHPAEAGETYLQHLLFTLGMALRLLVTSVVLIIHGLFPFVFCHTASRKMKRCQAVMAERAKMTGCPEENAPQP